MHILNFYYYTKVAINCSQNTVYWVIFSQAESKAFSQTEYKQECSVIFSYRFRHINEEQ